MKGFIIIIIFLSFLFTKGQGVESINFYGELLETSYINSKTGDTVRSTFWKQIDGSSKYLLNFRMLRKNSVYNLELSYHFGDGSPFSVSKGDSVWIKFLNGFKLVLYSNDSVTSGKGGAMIPGSLKGAVTYGVSVKYNLSQQQLMGFINNETEKIRIFSSKGYNDFNWRERKRALTIQAIKQLIEKSTRYKVCEYEPVNINRENANKDNF